jgi:hypothetical protein
MNRSSRSALWRRLRLAESNLGPDSCVATQLRVELAGKPSPRLLANYEHWQDRLKRTEEEIGPDSRVAKQLRIQIAVMEERPWFVRVLLARLERDLAELDKEAGND